VGAEEKRMSQYLACRIGREWYGISIAAVSEVLHILALRQVPNSDITGVMTLREKVMPVVDLRQHLGIEDYHYQLDTPIIALQLVEKCLGIIVDEADDVLTLPDETIQGYSDGVINGMARLDERLIFILNLRGLIAHYFETQNDELV
jgi:purine-binding chemotaxis protein CheW